MHIRMAALGSVSAVANSERAGDLPRIKMTAWIPMKDFCPAQ